MPASWLGSQNALMGSVFASRLLPFISFDVVSYAAGLTPLAWWRFAVATVAGIAPASFLLAHFGGEMASGEIGRTIFSALALGLIPPASGVAGSAQVPPSARCFSRRALIHLRAMQDQPRARGTVHASRHAGFPMLAILCLKLVARVRSRIPSWC